MPKIVADPKLYPAPRCTLGREEMLTIGARLIMASRARLSDAEAEHFRRGREIHRRMLEGDAPEIAVETDNTARGMARFMAALRPVVGWNPRLERVTDGT